MQQRQLRAKWLPCSTIFLRVSEENTRRIEESFERSPRKSTRRASRELGIQQPTVWRVLRRRLLFNWVNLFESLCLVKYFRHGTSRVGKSFSHIWPIHLSPRHLYIVYSVLRQVQCLLLKRIILIVRSSASFFKFKFQSILLYLGSSSSCLRLLPRLIVSSIIPSMTCSRRQFLQIMWPIKLALLSFIVCRMLFSSLTPYNTSSFFTWLPRMKARFLYIN